MIEKNQPRISTKKTVHTPKTKRMILLPLNYRFMCVILLEDSKPIYLDNALELEIIKTNDLCYGYC